MNILERYGIREGDQASLHSSLPVIGRRAISEVLENTIFAHSMPFFQLIYVESGELDWWVEGEFYHLSPGKLILVKPYETQSSLKGKLPVGERYFLQFNMYEKGPEITQDEWIKIRKLLSEYIPRTITVGKEFKHSFEKLLEAHRKPNSFSPLIAKAQFYEIISILNQAQESYLKAVKVEHTAAISIIKTVNSYINANLDTVITSSKLADLLELSEVHFRRKFQAASGISPIKYVNFKKLQEARRLLTETELNISQIAVELAFSSSQHFSHSFSKAFSLSPREYRKEVLSAFKKAPLKKVSQVSAEIASRFTKVDQYKAL
ncbi:AraC family transcriptional regulator [Lentisphaera marina]|uniref:helix-turn-helix domain-containing protein n=1 Tax=Lentisphaera marina TaxID=1111041 RepID=UPI002366D6B4|nr:AraC family transcriptional regulator [Lentisphaera marina]MDD7987195.1 AraC family transcriptional regulator [Lentisphaera marina]